MCGNADSNVDNYLINCVGLVMLYSLPRNLFKRYKVPFMSSSSESNSASFTDDPVIHSVNTLGFLSVGVRLKTSSIHALLF